MFKFICLFGLICAAFAASIGKVESTTEKREIIPVLKFERENNPDGSFKFSYEGGDQTYREETAHVVDAGTEDEALEVSGSYGYVDLDGNTVEVHYTAGKNGFVPVGTHILSEISAAAKAAADLPQIDEEEFKRKGRSNDEKKPKVVKQKAKENKVSEQKVKSPKIGELKKLERPQKAEEPKTVKEQKQVEDSKVQAYKVEETKVENIEKIPVIIVKDEEDKTKTA